MLTLAVQLATYAAHGSENLDINQLILKEFTNSGFEVQSGSHPRTAVGRSGFGTSSRQTCAAAKRRVL